ncbi:MAG: hypothetical protein K2K46_09610 [Lachnospiraceae bacterium]|nr:hypothetical protein [Lachnospiraceae bacterium]
MKGHLDIEQLKGYSYKDLQALAKDMGVNASGKAEEIIARIAAVEVDAPEESRLTEEEKATARQEEERAATEAAQAAKDAEKKAAAEQKARDEAAVAGLVTVKAVMRFLDKQLNQIKDVEEAYSVSRERAEELVVAGVAEIIG